MSEEAPKVFGCSISVEQPEVGFGTVMARFEAFGAAVVSQKSSRGVKAGEVVAAANAAAMCALRYAKLSSLAALGPDDWFALGDRLRRTRDGLEGQVVFVQRADDTIGVARPPLIGIRWSDGSEERDHEDDVLDRLRVGLYTLTGA